MKLLLSLCIVFGCSLLSSLAQEKKSGARQKAQAEFSKDITFMKLMEAKCRENKWKNFDWKIDEERSISMLSASHERPDIEPMLIRVNGADEFIVNKTEILNLEQIKERLNEYKQMAMSSGSKPIIAVHTGKLSAAVVHPVLVKLHQLGLTNIIFSKPKREATPVVKPPVNRRPASPHR